MGGGYKDIFKNKKRVRCNGITAYHQFMNKTTTGSLPFIYLYKEKKHLELRFLIYFFLSLHL